MVIGALLSEGLFLLLCGSQRPEYRGGISQVLAGGWSLFAHDPRCDTEEKVTALPLLFSIINMTGNLFSGI